MPPSKEVEELLARMRAEMEADQGAASSLRDAALVDYQDALSGRRDPNYGAMIGQALAGAIPMLVGVGMGGSNGLEAGAAAGARSSALAYQQQEQRAQDEDNLKQLIAKLKLDRAIELDKEVRDAKKEEGKVLLDSEREDRRDLRQQASISAQDARFQQSQAGMESRFRRSLAARDAGGGGDKSKMDSPWAGTKDLDLLEAERFARTGRASQISDAAWSKIQQTPGGVEYLKNLSYMGVSSRYPDIKERGQEHQFAASDTVPGLVPKDPKKPPALTSSDGNKLREQMSAYNEMQWAIGDLKKSFAKAGGRGFVGLDRAEQSALASRLWSAARQLSATGMRLEGREQQLVDALAVKVTDLDGATSVVTDFFTRGNPTAQLESLSKILKGSMNARAGAYGFALGDAEPITHIDIDAELGAGL